MRVCKYCNKPIAEKDIWNPDNDGNGYHHECLIDMEFKARDRQIYDKGKMDVLDKIRAEIKALSPEPTAYDVVDGNPIKDAVWETLSDVLKIIDKYKVESEV
jgi:hypothetical protein